MPKYLIIDDHPIVRKGLRQTLEEMPGVSMITEAGNSQEGLREFLDNDFDAVLLDINLPGKSGLEILADMKAMKPKVPVLIISMYPEEQYAIRALKSGASGYLTKEKASDELPQAILKLTSGGKYITPSIAEKIFNGFDSESSKHELLSNREFEVMMHISKGKPIKEIANMLSVSEKTVSTYRSRILEKMNMQSNADIVKYMIREDLID